jgi:hypothetical protein
LTSLAFDLPLYDKWQINQPSDNLKQLVLAAILQCEDEAYGVTIPNHRSAIAIEKRRTRAVYATLDRLEDKGLIPRGFRIRLGTRRAFQAVFQA